MPTLQPQKAQGQWFLSGLLGVLIGVLFVTTAVWSNWKHLSVDGLWFSLDDQVGYVSVARHWVDEGHLDSSLVYTSLVRQNIRRNSMYMPGFYAELAATYRMLGYSVVTSRLPAMVSFLLACWLVYWIAQRIYGTEAAIFSTAIFAFFPLNVVYAFSAMAEIPLMAASLAALAIFLRVPDRFRWWAGPIALTLPILFRETSMAFVLIMVLLLSGPDSKHLREALLCGALACVVFVALLVSPVGSGRPSMWKGNVLFHGSEEALYGDAIAVDAVPHSPWDWLSSIVVKTKTNVRELMHIGVFNDQWLERSAMLFLLSGIPLGFLLGWWRGDRFAFGIAASLALLLAADVCLYRIWSYRGVRSLLMLQPLIATLWGVVLSNCIRKWGPKIRYSAVFALFLVGIIATRSAMGEVHALDAETKQNTTFLESVIGDDRRMLVSPYRLSLDYVSEHYPQRWAFPPLNCPTLRLLDARWKIGVLITQSKPGLDLGKWVCGTDLQLEGERDWGGTPYWIYRRKQP